VERLEEIGRWLDKNGRAIYGTVTTPHYHDGDVWFTQSKDGRSLFAILTPCEDAPPVATISWSDNLPCKGQKVRLLSTGRILRHVVKDGRVEVTLPAPMPGSVALEVR
jgi:alpha-L-fucosidase